MSFRATIIDIKRLDVQFLYLTNWNTEKEHSDCFIGLKVYIFFLSPKFYDKIFLFVGLTTLGSFIKSLFDGLLIWVSKRFTEEIIMCFIIGILHQFIGHCLFPLDHGFLKVICTRIKPYFLINKVFPIIMPNRPSRVINLLL